jgi:hypothetical protein
MSQPDTQQTSDGGHTAPCVACGRPVWVGFLRCGECANTPPHLTIDGFRRLSK